MLITVGAIIGLAQVDTTRHKKIFFPMHNCVEGVGALTSPFLDTLSRYDSSRSTGIETTWDQVQTDVSCSQSVSAFTCLSV